MGDVQAFRTEDRLHDSCPLTVIPLLHRASCMYKLFQLVLTFAFWTAAYSDNLFAYLTRSLLEPECVPEPGGGLFERVVSLGRAQS